LNGDRFFTRIVPTQNNTETRKPLCAIDKIDFTFRVIEVKSFL
jgi:hypothetical protein